MRKLTLIVLAIFLLCAVTSYAAIPKLINYQGRLTDSQGRPLADGKRDKRDKGSGLNNQQNYIDN